jgi:hypothetical protein
MNQQRYYESTIRHAVAINNIGVTLLEKKCYGQALDTFHDAMYLMQQILRVKQEDDTANTTVPNGMSGSRPATESQSYLSSSCLIRQGQASHRLMNLYPYENNNIQTDVVVDLHVIDLFSVNQKLLDTILQQQQVQLPLRQNHKNPIYHVIRLEGRYNDTYDGTSIVETDERSDEESVPEFETSILLHNLGLAYLCMSIICCNNIPTASMMTTRHHHEAFLSLQYRNKAFQCFGRSYVIYAKTLSAMTTIHPSSMTTHLLGMILILQNILQMFHMCRCFIVIPCMEYDISIQYYQTIMDQTILELRDTQVWNHMVGFTCTTAGAA